MSESSPVSGVAGRYAIALFEVADESGQIETVESDLGQILQALADSEDFATLVASPLYGREEQGRAVAAVADAMGLASVTKNTLLVMASKRRLFTLVDMIRAFNRLVADKRGVVEAEVRTPKALTDAQRANLAETLKASVGRDVTLRETVDESLIGGLVVKIGSRMIDTSIRSKLNRLQTAMKEASL